MTSYSNCSQRLWLDNKTFQRRRRSWKRMVATSDGRDKLLCTKAITIISKKPWTIPIIDKSQFLKAISVINKLSPINISNKCCGKTSMCLMKFFV